MVVRQLAGLSAQSAFFFFTLITYFLTLILDLIHFS